jgi:hypothetical protein
MKCQNNGDVTSIYTHYSSENNEWILIKFGIRNVYAKSCVNLILIFASSNWILSCQGLLGCVITVETSNLKLHYFSQKRFIVWKWHKINTSLWFTTIIYIRKFTMTWLHCDDQKATYLIFFHFTVFALLMKAISMQSPVQILHDKWPAS